MSETSKSYVVIINFHGSVILPYCIKAKRCMGYWSGLALCLTKVRSSRARCPATALIESETWARPLKWPEALNARPWNEKKST